MRNVATYFHKEEAGTHCTQLLKKENKIKFSVHFQDSCFQQKTKLILAKVKLNATKYKWEVANFRKFLLSFSAFLRKTDEVKRS